MICGGCGLHLQTAVLSNYVADDTTALNTFLPCEAGVKTRLRDATEQGGYEGVKHRSPFAFG